MIIKNKIRYRFNLVEIALATAVIGIGLSSVLILFPIGLNASKSSVADNNIGDIAETVLGFVQTQYQLNWDANGTRSSFAANWPAFNATPDDNDVTTGTSSFFDADGKPKDSAKTDIDGLLQETTAGSFLFQQRTPDPEDPENRSLDNIEFEALIRVGTVENNAKAVRYPELGTGNWPAISENGTNYEYQPVATSGNLRNNLGGASADDALRKYMTSLVVEISWPVDAPWSQREKRVFVLDMFNERFQPYPHPQP